MTTILAAGLALLLAGTPITPADSSSKTCEVTADGASRRDVERARAACEIARGRFGELFGEPVPAVRILIEDRDGYRTGLANGKAAVLWPSTRAMRARVGTGARADGHIALHWDEILPHEISHVLLAARFFPDAHGSARAPYGSPLPDWIDEGVAIWAEPETSRETRIAQARALPPERRDLVSILTTPHPAAANREVLAIRDGAAIPDDQALWDFYPRSIAALAFLHDTGGRAATSELVRRIIAGAPLPHAVVGLPGLPGELAEIEVAFERWLMGDD